MAYPNGKVPLTVLKNLGAFSLLTSVANAYQNMQTVARLENNITIGPAGPYGSGYRDLHMQTIFYSASQGNRNDMAIAHLDGNSIIRVANPGYSSHGQGNRVDMLFNGRSPDSTDLAIAQRYGFTREFGNEDPNHFQHDGRTAVSGVVRADKIRLVAKELNGKHLGKTTNAEYSGNEDEQFIWLVQHYGHMEKWYPVACKEDGVTGPNTEHCLDTIWNHLSTR